MFHTFHTFSDDHQNLWNSLPRARLVGQSTDMSGDMSHHMTKVGLDPQA